MKQTLSSGQGPGALKGTLAKPIRQMQLSQNRQTSRSHPAMCSYAFNKKFRI
jgi:hypothetical protein